MNLITAHQKNTGSGMVDHSYGIYNYPERVTNAYAYKQEFRNSYFSESEFPSRQQEIFTLLVRSNFFANNAEEYQVKNLSTHSIIENIELIESFSNSIYTISHSTENVISIKNVIELSKNILGITPSQLARILGISRATLYNHMNNQNLGKIEEYLPLYEVCLEISEKYGTIAHGIKSVSINGSSLLRYLEKNGINKDYILYYAQKIHSKTGEITPNSNNMTIHQEKMINLISCK